MSAPAMSPPWCTGFAFIWARLQNKARYIIFRTLSACSKVWIPLISGAMVDIVATPDFPISHLCIWACVGLVVEIFNYATGTWLGYFWEKSVLFSTVDIRKTLWRKIQNISARRWDSLPVGTWQVRLVRDAHSRVPVSEFPTTSCFNARRGRSEEGIHGNASALWLGTLS